MAKLKFVALSKEFPPLGPVKDSLYFESCKICDFS